MAEEEKKKPPDERLDFMWRYISTTMLLKQEKWTKMITFEDYKVSVWLANLILY